MDNPNSVQISIPKDAPNQNQCQEPEEDFDYSQRSQWLRAAVLGANDGLVSIASLMMGVGAVKTDVKAMILTGFAGLVAGALSMSIGEFVSVYSQLEIEVAQIKRETQTSENGESKEASKKENLPNPRRAETSENGESKEASKKENLPNPRRAAISSGLAFSLGAVVPLLAAAFIGDHKERLIAIITAVSLALLAFGWIGAVLGNAPVIRSCARVLIGGWIAMAITFGLTKLISSSGLQI